MDAISSNASIRRYERDFLLQLRLHPFSLQKPKNLKNQDIVKDKLYLHQIDNCPGSQNAHLSSSRSACQTSIKPESEVMFRSHRLLPDCYPRSCPLYTPGYKFNSGYHGVPSSKSRPFYMPDSLNPVRKCSVPTSSEYKFDLSFEDIFSPTWPVSQAVPWSKQGSYDEVWNSFNRPLQSSTSKDHLEVPVKNKKTLPIIDPANGKNILEGILSSPSVSQESVEENDCNTKSRGVSSESDETTCDVSEGDTASEAQTNRYEGVPQNATPGEEFCMPQATKRAVDSHDLYIFSGEEECTDHCPQKDVHSENTIVREHGLDVSKEETEKSIGDYSTKKPLIDYENNFVYNNCEEPTAVNIPNTENKKDKENRNYQALPPNERNSSFLSLRDNTMRTEDQFKANAAMLREKLYSMRQEQQKMVIFQSFLRYKKQQLDEIFRNLDDQKIEIANWECNLTSKDKRLKEKECWLEAKRMELKNKEEELVVRERKLTKNSDKAGAGQSESVEVRNTKDAEPKKDSKSSQGVYENGFGEPEVDAESFSDEVKIRSINGVICNGTVNGIDTRKHHIGYSYEFKH